MSAKELAINQLNMTRKRKVRNDCEKATFLIEKRQVTKLTTYEYCYMTYHLAFCSMCRIFQRQSKLITQMTKNLFTISPKSALKLDENFKEELQARIDEKL